MSHLHFPVFCQKYFMQKWNQFRSGGYEGCRTCTFLCFAKSISCKSWVNLDLVGMRDVALALSCVLSKVFHSKVESILIWWVWGMSHLHFPVFCQKYFMQKLSQFRSGGYEGCRTCTILCFAKSISCKSWVNLDLVGMRDVALALSCVLPKAFHSKVESI